ncbi:MAG: hypothetical protein ACQ5SW_01980 [Sphaerochaetaceae bacterium]
MDILQYFLIILLIVITAINLYALTIGKKNRNRATANYQLTLQKLGARVNELMKEYGYDFADRQGYINDIGDGILLCFDTKKQVVGIALAETFYHFSYADFISCKQTYDEISERGKLSNISVTIETKEEIITLVFGTKAWRKNSYLGKFLLQDSKEFCSILERHCKKDEHQ